MLQKHTHTHTHLTALFPGLPGWAGTRKDFTEARDSEWQWHTLGYVQKSAPRSRQITMPAPHHSVFYRPDALPATQPIASKHWRQVYYMLPLSNSPRKVCYIAGRGKSHEPWNHDAERTSNMANSVEAWRGTGNEQGLPTLSTNPREKQS